MAGDTSSTWDGHIINFDDLQGSGGYDWFNAYITVGGSAYRLLHAYMVAGLREMDSKISGSSAALTATSAGAQTIGTGLKTFTLDATGKSMAVGEYVIAYQTSNPDNWMVGPVSSFSDPSVTINVLAKNGSGSLSGWTISIAGTPGTMWTTGSGAPSNANGNNGDMHLRSDTGHVYKKAGGSWSDTGVVLTSSITVHSTTTGNPGTSASVTNSTGTTQNPALDFVIPRGSVVTVASTTTGNPGTSASVTNSGSNGDVALNFTIPKGETGGGGPSVSYAWNTGTTDANPGTGLVRANNATLASATYLYVSTTDAGSVSVSAILAQIDSSTSSTKARLRIAHRTDSTKWAEYTVDAPTTSATGYRKVPITYVAGSGSFSAADPVSIGWSRVGDKGDIGDAGTLATETVAGVAEIATQAETIAGTDDARMITPAKLAGWTNGLSTIDVVDSAADYIPILDTSTGMMRKVHPSSLGSSIAQLHAAIAAFM